MKKITVCIAALLLAVFSLSAQASADPKDEFYGLVERWEMMGLINTQPPLRPYPLKLIEEILTTVIEGDNENEVVLAKECYARIYKRPYRVRIDGEGNVRFENGKDKVIYQIVPGLHLFGDFAFPKFVTAGYKLGVVATNDTSLDAVPQGTTQPYFFKDAISIKGFEAFWDVDASFAFKYENFYVQAGVNHSSFGPFYNDSAVISPNAKHTANFSLLFNGKKVSYTQALFGLSAVSPDPYVNALDRLNQETFGVKPEVPLFSKKFLAVHSLNAQIFKWLSASFYEAVIYGGRFEPAYLIPAPYMITQGLLGFDDNIFMGINFSVRPFKNLEWTNDFFLDDMELSQLLKLNFDTKIRGTFQSSIKYVFSNVSWLDMLRINYTMVTPYMYAHAQKITDPTTGQIKTAPLTAINYQEYTTAGAPLGLGLSPNTEQVSLSLSVTPAKWLKITGRGSYSRHGNVNESLSITEMMDYINAPEGYFSTDGGIHNHQNYFKFGNPIYDIYVPSAWEQFLFVSQDTLMHTVKAGADIDFVTPDTKFGRFTLSVGYTFEYIINYGVDNQIFSGNGGQYNLGNLENPEQLMNDITAAYNDVQQALAAWKAQLTNKMNHYISVTLKYEW